MRLARWVSGVLLLLACALPAFAARTYRTVVFSEAAATIVDAAGKSRPARVGTTIFEGETIVTGNDGEIHARTDDHGLLALRSNTSVKVDEFRAQADAEDKTVLALVKGTFRSITGWIGKSNPKAYRVRTTVATIGIRGTDHEPMFIPPGPGAPGLPGTYDKVNSGGTYIENKSGRVNVESSHAGFAPHDGTAPRVLEKVPEFFKPTRNEGRIAARKAELEKEMAQARLERQKAAAAEAEKEKAQKAAEAKQKADKEAADKSASSDKSGKADTPDKTDKSEKVDDKSAEKPEKEEHKKPQHRRHPPNTK